MYREYLVISNYTKRTRRHVEVTDLDKDELLEVMRAEHKKDPQAEFEILGTHVPMPEFVPLGGYKGPVPPPDPQP